MKQQDMKTQVVDFAKQRWADFRGFSPGQKAVTIVAVLALAIGGYLLATWKSDPTYSPLYSNLAASDASAIVGKLNEKGISYKLTDGGAGISVPADQVDSARLAVSASGLPNSGQTGYALLDKQGVTTSQFQQQVNYQRAVEGELARTIQSIDGVQSASVHLAIPQDDVFSDNSTRPTAAVLLGVAPGTALTTSQVQTVVNLVSSSVTGMKAGDVTVSDSNGNVLSAPDTGVSGTVNADTQAQQTLAYNNRVAASIQAMIDTSLGTGHAKVMVNSTLDYDKSTTRTNKYVYDKNTPPVSESETKEKYTGAGSGAGGTLGTGAAVDTNGTNGTGSGKGNYTNTSKTVNNALGTISNTTEAAPGGLKNLHIAVVLDRNAKGLDPTAITNLVKSGVGFSAARGDSFSLQTLPFNTAAATAATQAGKAAAAAAAEQKAHEEMVSLIKQGAFAALLLVIVIGTWIASRKRRKARKPVPAPVADDPELLDELMPEPEPEPERDRVVRASDAERAAERRRQLVLAADNRPSEVAHLLSGWLSPSGSGREN